MYFLKAFFAKFQRIILKIENKITTCHYQQSNINLIILNIFLKNVLGVFWVLQAILIINRFF